jgi:hypothetical protein
MQVIDKESYQLGLEDAIKECEVELAIIDVDYGDAPSLKRAAWRSVKNCILMLQSKLKQIEE